MNKILIRIKYLFNEYKRKIFYVMKKEKITIPKDKNAYVFLAADYGNIGDIAITYAQKNFLRENIKGYNIIEIPILEVNKLLPFLKKKIRQNDIITIIGGGNLTNRYDVFEEKRRMVIKNFKNHKIISFPQTIEFTDDILGHESKRRSQKIYSTNPNLILFAREEKSYKLMKEIFSKNKVYLAPDIVISLKREIKLKTIKDGKIGICLRNDKEKSLKINLQEELKKHYGQEIETLSTVVDDKLVTMNNKYDILFDLLKKFASKDVIITDRLHGMIFCYLTETPCIVFDNDNNKIKGTYEKWLSGCNYIRLLGEKDANNIYQSIDELRYVKPVSVENEDNYKELVKEVRGEKNE